MNNIKYQQKKTYPMTSYKEKYHLKKTQPILNRQKPSNPNLLKQLPKSEKATNIKTPNNPKHNAKAKYSELTLKKLKENQLNLQQEQRQTEKQVKNQQKKQNQSQNQKSCLSHQHRAHSVSIVQKFVPPPTAMQSLQYPKRNTFQNLQKINIISSVQNFFTRIMKPDNGCICQQPCQWAGKWFSWVDIPEHIILSHYQQLRQKVNSTFRNKNGIFQVFENEEQEFIQYQKQKNFKQIRKDIERTHSDSQTFKNPIFLRRLQNVLKCYVVEDIKMGYVQGMNMILAGILYHVKEQAKTYSIFRKLLYSIRSIYLDGFRQCYIHINRIQQQIRIYLFDVYVRLDELDIQLHMICLPWILSLLTSIVPLEDIHLIYYGFIKERWNFIYKICISLFVYFKDKISQATEASQVLMLFGSGQEQLKEIDWTDIIKYGQKIQINFSN